MISPPGLGALTCGMLWCGGRYRLHTELMRADSRVHPEDCPCHLYEVYDTMKDGRWIIAGVGKTADGRWVVELGEAGVMSSQGRGAVRNRLSSDSWETVT